MRRLNNKLIVTLLMMTLSMMANAQNILNATLQHGDELTVYSGADGFKNAYNKSLGGDIIYLSPGTFNGDFYIDKSISIYGSGMVTSKDDEIQSTIVNGTVRIARYNSVSNLTIEGISFNELYSSYSISQTTITKCSISQFSTSSYNPCYNILIDQCTISSFNISDYSSNCVVKNSRLGNVYYNSTSYDNFNNSTSTLSFVNCDIETLSKGITAMYINNIIHSVYSFGNKTNNQTLTNYSTAFNNLFLHGQGTPDGAFNASGNYVLDAESEEIIYVNADETGMSLTGSYYELTDEAAAKYLGQDGTQVGIHGGETPFSIIPSYPHIVEKNIAGQSTSDGKLKVNIKVDVK